LVRQKAQFKYPFMAKEVVEFFRPYFGPTQTAFLRLDEAGQSALAAQSKSLWTEYNSASDGTTSVEAEYLDVCGICAGSVIKVISTGGPRGSTT
jgi:hypothetical protein